MDDATIAANSFGAKVRALIDLWDREHKADWRNRFVFLATPSAGSPPGGQ